MTKSADFAPDEWNVVREGPTSAGLIVSTAQRGGTIREIFAMAKVYAEARAEHGDSELLDELVAAKPDIDRTKSHSPEELKERGLQRIRDAVALVESRGTTEELGDYRNFVISLCERVAGAKSEGGQEISEAEGAAIVEIKAALGV